MGVHKCRSRRGISEPEVQVVGQGVGRRGQAAGIRLGEPDQAGVEGRRPAIQGPASAVEAHLREHRYRRRDRDSVDAEPPPVQTEVVADADAERVGESALYNHPARAHPRSLGDVRLVHGCPRGLRIEPMRHESSTVVAVVGEFGNGLLAGLTQSPNVSVARVPDDAAGQPSADEAVAGRRPGWEAGALALREAARRRSTYVIVPDDPLAEVAAAWRAMWELPGGSGGSSRTGRPRCGGEVRGTRRRGAGRLARQAVRAA